jgi:hypothetical protein
MTLIEGQINLFLGRRCRSAILYSIMHSVYHEQVAKSLSSLQFIDHFFVVFLSISCNNEQ